jgi:hypothetical protein
VSKLEELKRHNAKKRFIDPEQSEENHGQNDDYDSDKHAGHMFLAVLDEKKVLVDVPRKVDPKKLGMDLIGNIIMTGMDDERLASLKSILQKAPRKVSLYMTQALRCELDEKLGDFDKVDEHIVKEARDFDVNGVNVTLMKVDGSNELKVILRSGETYHQGNWISKEDIREKLASMIHNEWMSWSKAVAGDVDPARKARWEKLWTPYDQLTEPQKDQDRIWADKVLKVMHALNKGEEELVTILGILKSNEPSIVIVEKDRGVSTSYGPAPGPPPRPGLEWKPETHRWIRPGEEHTEATSSVQYETENKDMTEALVALKVSDVEYAEVGNSWVPETVGILKDNADAHLGQYEKFFDATTYNKARSAAYAVINSARGAKTSAAPKDVQDLVTSSVDKLVYQEMRAWERQVSDHGIRHIVGNMTVQDRISRALISGGGKITPQERFMMNIIAINHDMGYIMGDARISTEGTKKHKRYSQEFFDHEREFYKKFFDDTQLDLMSDIIAHHDDTNVDWVDDPVMTTVCMADNLSLFHEDKLPSLYRYVEGALDSLYEMQKGLRANDPDAVANAKVQLLADIDTSKLPEYSKSWLRQAANEVSKYTVKYTIPMLIGNVEGFDYEENKGLAVNINEDPFDSKIADIIDMGQTQYAKFAKDYDVDLKDNDTVEFKKNGRVHLTMNIKRHRMEKMMYGEYAIDMIFKAGKVGLVPKKVMVNREGKQFLQTFYVKPGAQGEDVYKQFIGIDYNRFFGRRAKYITEAIVNMTKELDTQRLSKMGEKNHYRSIEMMQDWIHGVPVRMISIRMINAAMNGKEFTKGDTKKFIEAVISAPSEKSVDMAYDLGKIMSYDLGEDMKPTMQPYIDVFKAEKKFTEEKAKELFGDTITLYRGVYGSVVKDITEKLDKDGKIELEESPFTSYSQDATAAFGRVIDKGDYFVFKQEISVTDIVTAWFSNPMFVAIYPEQKECVIDRKEQKFVLKSSDIVMRS